MPATETAMHSCALFEKHIRAFAAIVVAVCAAGVCPLPCWGQWTQSGNTVYTTSGAVNVGIGTASPGYPLQVVTGSSSVADFKTTGANSYITLTDSGGTGEISASSGTLWLGGGAAAPLYFRNNGYNTRMTILANGSVGIGTTSPQHMLHVAGTIGAEEVLVTSTGADYVFEPGYRLRPLPEVASYIRAEHHLPDIPSADEVKRKGMGVGEMEAKLLAKVEELTLHLIREHERNEDLQARIARLEAAQGKAEPIVAESALPRK